MTATPSHRFDLSDPSTLKMDLDRFQTKDLLDLVVVLDDDMRRRPDPSPFALANGWHEISPAIALDLLRRNRPGANRKIDPQTVLFYARQMADGDWVPTGEPFILDQNGLLLDAQHRALAVLISGATITSYVVADVPPRPNIFAYIDNSRPRTVATALQTSGLDGVSPTIAEIMKLGEQVRAGAFDPAQKVTLMRISPAQSLRIIDSYPNAQRAARSAVSDWRDTVAYIGRSKAIVGYHGMRIIDVAGEDVADDFFTDLMDDRTDRPSDDPIAAFRREIDKDKKATKQMKKQHVLAALIKVYNAWRREEPLGRRWMLQVNEPFPAYHVDERSQSQDAAE
jgi:hypothetical protein